MILGSSGPSGPTGPSGPDLPPSALILAPEDDPDMLRPYIVMLANPKVFPHVNYDGAQKLQNYLLSEEVQEFLEKYRADEFGGIPLFYPLRKRAFKETEISNN